MEKKKKLIKKRLVSDETNREFELLRKIGEGGQGVVCQTQISNILVKINTQKSSEKKKKWLEHIRWLMWQPLEGLKVARPFSQIASNNNPGYAMELMDGLIPLERLINDTEIAMSESGGNPEKYLQTGGIKRRMRLLAKLARILSDLHGRGMAYGDLSPANVFISEEIKHDEVWLIDCDNICINQRNSFDSEIIEGKAGRVWSPGFGAPEVVNGEFFVSSLTDSWSFAVIAFKLLTTNHPFIGDAVDNGTPDDVDKAFSGELPWIYHPEDFSNKMLKGLPIEIVALKPLRKLFEQCFNIGKGEPLERPSLSEWAEKLEQMSCLLAECQNSSCNATYNFPIDEIRDKSFVCPFCDTPDEKQNFIVIRYFLQDTSLLNIPNTKKDDSYINTDIKQTLNLGHSLSIKSSPPGSFLWEESKELFVIKLSPSGIQITPAENISISIEVHTAKPEVINKMIELSNQSRKSKLVKVTPIDQANEDKIKSVYVFIW
jgi:eukaryotic-like serine/threonine-protein kinase